MKAFSLNLPTRFGIKSTYNEIFGAKLNSIDNLVQFELLSYADESAKNNDGEPLERRNFSFPSIVESAPAKEVPAEYGSEENGEQQGGSNETIVNPAYKVPAVTGYTITTSDDLTEKSMNWILTQETFKNAKEI